MFGKLKHDGWPKFLPACKESPGFGVVVDHPDDVGGGYVGEDLYLFGVIFLRLCRGEVQFDDEVLIALPGQEGVALAAVSHGADDGVGLNKGLCLHYSESKN